MNKTLAEIMTALSVTADAALLHARDATQRFFRSPGHITVNDIAALADAANLFRAAADGLDRIRAAHRESQQ
jgi:hypothetical protein